MECFDHKFVEISMNLLKCVKCGEEFTMDKIVEMADLAAERMFEDLRCIG